MVAHSASYGWRYPHFYQAPLGAADNQRSITQIFRPVRGLTTCWPRFPQLPLWATTVRHSVAEMLHCRS